MKRLFRIDQAERLYVIPEPHGFSCLGFDVCESRTQRLAAELLAQRLIDAVPVAKIGTRAHYGRYKALCNTAKKANAATGWRSQSELSPQLLGKEGRRVEVVTTYGEKRRFWVGRSTGHIPCHLEIARKNCHGGPAASFEYKTVSVIR